VATSLLAESVLSLFLAGNRQAVTIARR